MKKFVNFSFCAVFVLAVCLTSGCKAPSGGGKDPRQEVSGKIGKYENLMK